MSSTTNLLKTQSTEAVNNAASHGDIQRHPHLWFEDGSIDIILTISGGTAECRLHRDFLARLSPTFGSQSGCDGTGNLSESNTRTFEDSVEDSADLEALFLHIYHINPVILNPTFDKIASVLRASHKHGFESIGDAAQAAFQELYPPDPFADFANWERTEEAAFLSVKYFVEPALKPLLYTLITEVGLGLDENEDPNAPTDDQPLPRRMDDTDLQIKANIVDRCRYGFHKITQAFTPSLFQPTNSGHMKCTDILAGRWSDLVVLPALQHSWASMPIQALREIRKIDWAAEGVCGTCCLQKDEDWKKEAEEFWEQLDDLLQLSDYEKSSVLGG
ncbi:hypothetical protein SISSUDRAFT_298153 [Sistotremastrum suecicum HHB10207 ss-3]|uniref:BTB domain-containing protein n=1 Tax=Sistotremastrum suecicum HHB10207 ss-3 TaxID=1314776 RepID=A0A165ZFP6_9AGAM|nr:hypothetical protein SISSUDRAFT_298153 [Sistotremastrum suecicum HHB10207 ss-3]